MANLATVNLIKGESTSWGFRLQGGKDFATPLMIQKVIVGSPAERAGLVAGDSVIKVNATDVYNLRHKDAQDVLLRAGNSFSMTIQRGGSTWKPSVVPIGPISSPTPTTNNVSPVTKTSLAAKPAENIASIGTGHNVSAKPFLNGNVNGGGPKVVNNQYNSPLKLYSEESIAETLSAQTEVLSTGALGVNFKKNERNYDASKSAVLSLLKEEECRSKTPEHIEQHLGPPSIDSSSAPIAIAGLRHVTAPENRPQPPSLQLPPGQNICADCERLIVGVFVRIKDKNLHVECFKCSTCGTSLKNIGYFNINNKLYCDIHAKLAAKSNPPALNLVPLTVSPSDRVPANAISAALASHSAPSSPKINSHQISSSGPKPFGSVSGPISGAPNVNFSPGIAAPLSPISSSLTPSFSPVSSAGRLAIKPVQQTRNFLKGTTGGRQIGAIGVSPKRGRGVLNAGQLGGRIPLCGHCHGQIRGPFITALGKIWCPNHFVCATSSCKRPLQDMGFVEEDGHLYCEYCFEQFLAPNCSKCGTKIKGDCLRAIGQSFHPECFNCIHCGKLFGNCPFFIEEGSPYCEADWNELFTTKCYACGFPVEAGDRWVEALNNNFHSQCFNCTMCKKNLEGQSFFAKGGRPYCKNHAR